MQNENIKNLIIINKDNIKRYENIDLDIKEIFKKLKGLANNKNIKKIERFYFKYYKKYPNLNEKLKENQKLRHIFLEEMNKLLEDLKAEEKEFILNKAKKNLLAEKNFEELEWTDPINLFLIEFPLLLFEKSLNTLIIFSGHAAAEIKNNFIEKVYKELGIKIEEIDNKEYLNLKKELDKKLKGKKIEEILNNNDKKLKLKDNKELEKLKKENKELKKLSKNLIKELEKLENNYAELEEFVEKDLISLIYELLNNDMNIERKEKIKKELEQNLKYKPLFNPQLSPY